jgi:hypothetical protein
MIDYAKNKGKEGLRFQYCYFIKQQILKLLVNVYI